MGFQNGRKVAVLNAEERHKNLLDAMRDPFVCVDTIDGKLLLCNDAFCAMLGYEREELYSKTCPELTPKKWHDLEADIVRNQVLPKGFSGIYEKEYQRKDGSVLPVELLTTLRRDEDGNPVEMMAVVRDITERKLSEQERESTIELLRIANASTGIREMVSAAMLFFRAQSCCSAVGIRLHEGEDYPYYVAQGFPPGFVRAENSLCSRDACGEIVRDANGAPVIECMCGNVISGRLAPLKPFFTAQGSFWTNSTTEFLATASEADWQCGARNRCNTAGFESLALIPLRAGDERLGLLQLNDLRKGVFSPEKIKVWERLAGYLAIALVKFRSEESLKKLNQELDRRVQERTCRLEEALREQESFSYSVSHDLRAPLRHINSHLAILAEDFGECLPPEARASLDRSRSATVHMGKLIDNLLDLSRVSRSALEKKVVNLSRLATSTCDWLHKTDPSRDVEFVILKGLRVQGDKLLLQQMIGNLLENSWKYSSKVPAARIEFGREVVAGRSVFYVRDNGVGFDMEYKDNLFGAFQRLHGMEYEGTGIGLATVKRIIERHGGSVWAESKINEGATFYFSLGDEVT